MNPPVNQRVSPNWVALILVLLLAAWLVFEFYPQKKPVPPLPTVAAESKLRSLGLADNPDWEGLPELFAVWANRVEWNGDKAYFAYWHPGSRSYAYFFEVARKDGGYRFREISPQWLSDEGYNAEDGDAPIHIARRESEVPTHPFVFLSRLKIVPPDLPLTMGVYPRAPAKPTVPVDLQPAPLVVPPPAKPTSP